MVVRVLSWNLGHGRAVPSAGHHLLGEFADALSAWEWDVALLQEVPPWWPEPLGRRTGAESRTALTSRNALLPARRALATRWPDLMKSNGGGANAILVRGGTVLAHRRRRLCTRPERRVLHGVALRGGPFANGLWVGNLHATAHHTAAAQHETRLAARTALSWALREPCVLGGDFNLRALALDGFAWAGGHDVDHVFVRGLRATASEVLQRGRLSDHAPVLVTVTGESH